MRESKKTRENLLKLLKNYRTMTNAALAELIGISEQTMYKWRRELLTKDPSLEEHLTKPAGGILVEDGVVCKAIRAFRGNPNVAFKSK